MTRYSALKQPPLSTAQGGSTSPFSIFRHPAKTAPLPLKNALPQKRTPGIPSAGNPANRDSINAKVLGGEREGIGEGKGNLSGERFPFPSPMPHYFTGLNNSQSPAISKGTHKSCPIVSQPKAR